MSDVRSDTAPRPLRVLHLASHGGINAGGAVQMARMAIGLKERGHEVTCVFNRHGQGNFAALQRRGVRCETLRMQHWLSRVCGDERRLGQMVNELGIDVVHCHKVRALRFALGALKKQNTPIVAQRGNCYPLDDHTRRLMRNEQVRAVVCVADAVRNVVVEGGIESGKAHTIYGGVDLREFDATLDGASVRHEFGIPNDAQVVGLVANFDGKKAHDFFFRACQKIKERVLDVRFLVVGRDAPAEVGETLQKLGLTNRVILTGYRRDVPQLMAAMNVSVNVSTGGEGLTGTMRESLAMQKAVVCTDVGGNRELVRSGETGWLVAPNDENAFVEAVVEALTNVKEAQRRAQNGYELVLREFTEEMRIQKLEKLYDRVLEEARSEDFK